MFYFSCLYGGNVGLMEHVLPHCHHAEHPASDPRTQKALGNYQHCLH